MKQRKRERSTGVHLQRESLAEAALEIGTEDQTNRINLSDHFMSLSTRRDSANRSAALKTTFLESSYAETELLRMFFVRGRGKGKAIASRN